MKYNSTIVSAYFVQCGLPEPCFEYQFHPVRRWRFDLAWPEQRVAVEVDGGIWIRGGHNRGAQIKKDWEKRNEATAMGWQILFCEPRDLCLDAMVELLKRTIQ